VRLDRVDEAEEPMNLTSLTDVVFLLMIFFLCVTTFSRDEVEMDLSLPSSGTGKAQEEAHPIVINVRQSGELVVDGRVVTVEALRQKLLAAARRNKDQEVLIRGDIAVQYGVVANVLDACRAAALRQIALGALRVDPSRAR
jgi:biopolymer transport protein ExbD